MQPTQAFKTWLENRPSPWLIGEIIVLREQEQTYALCHQEDEQCEIDHKSINISDARIWVKFDAMGGYRPLKSEKNLSRGWRLSSLSFEKLVAVLNIFYPTAVANWAYYEEGKLPLTPFEETAQRQSGMYRCLQKITPLQFENVFQKLCQQRCLKVALWNNQSSSSQASSLPLLCPEACSLFLTSARIIMQGKQIEE